MNVVSHAVFVKTLNYCINSMFSVRSALVTCILKTVCAFDKSAAVYINV